MGWWIVAVGWSSCAAAVWYLAARAPVIEYGDEDEIERINNIIASARYHREQLEARADELVRSHGYQWGTADGDDLADVAFRGVPYAAAMERIMRRKASRMAK